MALTRDQARQAYGKAGHLSRKDEVVTEANMFALRRAINARMLQAGLMDGTFHMEHPSKIEVGVGVCSLRCQAFHFNNREAVTFNPDGFVGFAGWADETNVQPILQGFMDWLPTIDD